MLLLRYRGPILCLGFLVLGVLVVGCGRREIDDNSGPNTYPRFGSGGGGPELGTPVKPGKATVKGRITLEGMPDLAKLNQEFEATMKKLASPGDRPHCLGVGDHTDQIHEQDWKIGAGGGLGEVFVYLRPAGDSYFAVDPDDSRVLAARKAPAVIDQPHCVYVPHVTRVLPYFRDLQGKEEKDVQSLLVLNTSKIGHNVAFPDGKNDPLSSETGKVEVKYLKADYTPLGISCKIHPWMNANILVLDHPYSAITDKDGNFEIKDAPEGKVRLIVWHGKLGFITDNKARGIEVELKNGETLERNFTPSYRQ